MEYAQRMLESKHVLFKLDDYLNIDQENKVALNAEISQEMTAVQLLESSYWDKNVNDKEEAT